MSRAAELSAIFLCRACACALALLLASCGRRETNVQRGDRTQVLREIPVDGYDAEPWNGVTDYCFYHPDGSVLAVVEAKRCCRDSRVAEEQLRHYVTEIARRQPYAPASWPTAARSGSGRLAKPTLA